MRRRNSDGHAPRTVQERVEQQARENFTGRKSNRQKGRGVQARRNDGDDGNTGEEVGLTTGEANDAHENVTRNKMEGDDYSQRDTGKARKP